LLVVTAVAFNWRPTHLFIGVKVIDDTHQLNGASGWNGDSMQVVFANDARDAVTHLCKFFTSNLPHALCDVLAFPD